MLRLYNSKTRKKQLFIPLKDKEVKMYVCGITPYDTTHLGHAFTYVFFDVLVRYLTFKGYKVIYVQNVTDIDDDILRKAKEEGKDWKELGEFWTKQFLKDMKNLNVLPPTFYVKATSSIPQMITIIKSLVIQGFAYEKEGNVYFEIKKVRDYGKLSHFNRAMMLSISKERGNNPNDPLKKDPLDFVLWQKSRPEDSRPLVENEPFWSSPWGRGRPGWHIECSAMIYKYLGEQVDIHGGGRDLVFPHHESEIAQTELFTHKKPFVKYWLHTEMVLCEGEKMSKSLGNLILVSDLLEKYSPRIVRFYLLSYHYRSPWEFDEVKLNQAKSKLALIDRALSAKAKIRFTQTLDPEKYEKRFIRLMDDDLNIPETLIVLERIARRILQERKRKNVVRLKKILQEGLFLFGL